MHFIFIFIINDIEAAQQDSREKYIYYVVFNEVQFIIFNVFLGNVLDAFASCSISIFCIF